jgi:hypothetical protein
MSILKDFEQEAKMIEEFEYLQKRYKQSQENNRDFNQINRHVQKILTYVGLLWNFTDEERDKKITEGILEELVSIEKVKEGLRNRVSR